MNQGLHILILPEVDQSMISNIPVQKCQLSRRDLWFCYIRSQDSRATVLRIQIRDQTLPDIAAGTGYGHMPDDNVSFPTPLLSMKGRNNTIPSPVPFVSSRPQNVKPAGKETQIHSVRMYILFA